MNPGKKRLSRENEARRSSLLDVLQGDEVGKWVNLFPAEKGVYLFLFGLSGEVLSWLLPSREEIGDILFAGKEETKNTREPRLVVVTENPNILGHAVGKGHYGACIAGCANLAKRDRLRWILGNLFNQVNVCSVGGVLATPEFWDVCPKPKAVFGYLWKAHRLLGKPLAQQLPALLTTDVYLDFQKAYQHFRGTLPKIENPKPIELYHYGTSRMFDYRRMEPTWRVHSLGWRVENRTKTPRQGEERIFVYIENPASRFHIVNEIKRAAKRLAIKRVVVWGQPNSYTLENDGLEFVSNTTDFLDRAVTGRGLVVADGDGMLLSFLNAECRVALVRNASYTRHSLVRCAYFAGTDRWPTFESASDLNRELSLHDSLDAFWKPWEDKASPIEADRERSFPEGFIQALQALCANTTQEIANRPDN